MQDLTWLFGEAVEPEPRLRGLKQMPQVARAWAQMHLLLVVLLVLSYFPHIST